MEDENSGKPTDWLEILSVLGLRETNSHRHSFRHGHLSCGWSERSTSMSDTGVSTDVIGKLLQEMKSALRIIYGENLSGLYLYGSRARREGGADSDVDVLIVLKNFVDYWEEIQRTSQVVSELSLRYGVTVSPIRIREADWLKGDSPFLNVVRNESVPA